MKISLLAGVAVAAMVLAAPIASSADVAAPAGPGYRPYVSLFGGASILTKNPHATLTTPFSASADLLMNSPGYIIGGAVGIDWGNQIRTEVELSHARWTSDTARVNITGSPFDTPAHSEASATYLLGNAWLDLTQGSTFTPYVGGGLGIGWTNVDGATDTPFASHYNSSGLAFQLGAGVRVDLSSNISIDAGYRFKDIVGLNYSPDANTGIVLTDTSLASHNFQVGLTLKF